MVEMTISEMLEHMHQQFQLGHSVTKAEAATEIAALKARVKELEVNTQGQDGGVQSPPDIPFQARVQPWMMECFGPAISADAVERNDRFIEEALELVQANRYTADRAHALVDYVFGRQVGEPAQEVGGVMVTLAALCLAAGLDMHAAAETELARIWTKVEQIRAKQASKPTGSALPVPTQAADVTWLPLPVRWGQENGDYILYSGENELGSCWLSIDRPGEWCAAIYGAPRQYVPDLPAAKAALLAALRGASHGK